MSIAIDTNKVTKVLLADGWHKVLRMSSRGPIASTGKFCSSFDLDAYEIGEFCKQEQGKAYQAPLMLLKGGFHKECGIPSTGATWYEKIGKREVRISCPLTSILAIEEDREAS